MRAFARRFAPTSTAALLAIAASARMRAQDPPPVDPVAQQASALIDRFHQAMPHDPAELRQAEVRRKIAPAAVPVLREIRAFATAHPDAAFRGRALEFTLYGLVLDDELVVAPLRERSAAGDVTARWLLDCSAVIQAADAKTRAAAVDAVATRLRNRERPTATDAALSGSYCLTIAGGLSAAEAKVLASSAVDATVARRFEDVAQAAAKDARRLLEQPFELAGRTVTGAKFSTTSLRGKVVLIDFWATWCQPCLRGLPAIVQARQQYGARGLEVVGVSCDRDEAALVGFLAEHKEVAWTQLFEPGQKGFHPLAEGLGVTAIPRLFLIDKKGVLRCVDAHDKLDEWITRLLAE